MSTAQVVQKQVHVLYTGWYINILQKWKAFTGAITMKWTAHLELQSQNHLPDHAAHALTTAMLQVL